MKMQPHRATLILCVSLAGLGLFACGTDGGGGNEAAGTETDGTETGDPTTTSNGDGDGDPTTGDGDGDGDGDTNGCVVGSEGCPCTGGGGCDPGLVCEVGVCTPSDPTTGDGDGDPTTGDGDGDGDPSGDGDGDPNPACAGDEFIAIDVGDFASANGWAITQSQILMGAEVLAWDQQTQAATVTWDIEVPCADTWHVWVRGLDQGNNDSYFVSVDGQPDPAVIFELACDAGPQQGTYLWRELNYRALNAGACVYLFDPWTQDWEAGTHQLTLRYRESIAIAGLWVTNTNQTP
jgi:hypothetical protein